MHPYVGLPPKAFWKQAVSDVSALHLSEIYEPRFEITRDTRIAAAGSCFAQHIGRQFKTRGYRFVDVEPAPEILGAEDQHAFGYDLYSARFGNLYSARQLVQLFKRASGDLVPVDQVWDEGGRFYDPYRPTIEPDGFESLAELETSRAHHLQAVSTILAQTDVFVFTFGLTEAWRNLGDGVVYPTCPGTVHGTFDTERHGFVNFSWPDVMADFEEFIRIARGINPAMRFLVTVSPVPLTATASGRHVLAATMASKSILRAVCAELYERYDFLDYFPSYELVASHPMRAMFFDPNLRTVAPRGVAHVMDNFFGAHGPVTDAAPAPRRPQGTREPRGGPAPVDEDDVVCDEAILETFGR
jgi:hypothetical protein